MEYQLVRILGKPTDFKICMNCNKINWYENDCCISCEKKRFNYSDAQIRRDIEEDYKYYKKEGYAETEIDEICIDV